MKETQINNSLVLLQSELGFSFKEQEDFYKDILEEYDEDPFFMDQSPTDNFVFMEETIFCQNWLRVVKELNEHQKKSYKSFTSEVQLFETSEEIAKFAADKLNVIQLQLQNNKWSHLLNLKNFPIVLNKEFVGEVFQETFSLLDGKLYKWQTEINPHQRWTEESIVRKYQDIVKEDFFTEFAALLLILSEAKLLQIFKRESAHQQEVTTGSNPYPLVFVDKQYYQFFIYCMEAYKKPYITKTLISKYFEFFKMDNFLLENIKPKNFFYFVQEELNIQFLRIESYTSPDIIEKGDYESLKISFFK